MAEIRTYGTKDDILSSDAHPTEDVFVAEFGNKWYRVRGLSGAERERYEVSLGVYSKHGEVRTKSNGSAIARLVRMSVVDAADKQLFKESDIQALADLSAAGLSKIADAARRLSGLTEADMEELEGNFEGDQSDSSSSSSLSLSVAPSENSSIPSPVAN